MQLTAEAGGREPTLEQIATAACLPPEEVEALLQLVQQPISLDAVQRTPEGISLNEVLEDATGETPATQLARQQLREEIDNALQHLGPHEREVLMLRYGLQDGRNRTCQDVGNLLGVSREHARQVEKTALAKLRHVWVRQHPSWHCDHQH